MTGHFDTVSTCAMKFSVRAGTAPCFGRVGLVDAFMRRIGDFSIVIIATPLLPSAGKLVSQSILVSVGRKTVLVGVTHNKLVSRRTVYSMLTRQGSLFITLSMFRRRPLSRGSSL